MWRSLLRLSVLLVCGCWLVAQNPQLEEAWSLAAKGDRSAALTLLNRLVQQTPQDPDVRLLYGSLLSEAGQGPEALQQLSEGVRLRPNSAEAQDALGEALNHFGNSTAARLHFQKAVELKPDFPEARLNLGETLVAANEFEPAAKQLDKAIALFGSNPDVADARYLRGKVYSAQGDFMHAAAQFELAVAARPDFAAAWSDLGQSKKESLDDSGALSAFQRAVQINPQDAIAQYRLGAQYMAQGQMDSAIDHLKLAADMNPTDQSTLNSLQMALRRAARPLEAEQIKERLAAVLRKRDRDDQNALNAIKRNNEGAKLEKTGDFGAASEKYKEALSLNPNHVGIRVNYGVALLRLGKWQEGLTELREAARRDPTNQIIQAAITDAMKQAPHP